MNKSILIIETPKSCGDCRFCDYIEPIKSSICTANPSHMFKMNDEGAIYSILVDDRCPLRPLPKKKIATSNGKIETSFEYAHGFNDCVRAITGETE